MTLRAGAIRFNTDLNQMEIHDGNQWTGILATSPEQQTGGTRGVVMAGNNSSEPNGSNVMQYTNISTTGNTVDFGNLSRKKYGTYGGISSRTRGLLVGGYFYNEPNGPGTYIDDMDAITISITGDSFDFGNLSQGNRSEPGARSNQTRGIIFGGTGGPSPIVRTNTITYVTIAQLGNGVDFGDMTALYQNPTGAASQTRLVMGTGEAPSGSYNTLEYVTFATTGNAQDFGTTAVTASYRNACGNAVRGVVTAGYTPSTVNTIEFFTIATLGDATDFGDLTSARGATTAMSSPTRAVFAGGRTPSIVDTIDFVSIMTTGNAVAFGDLLDNIGNCGSVSNGHGGL